jgi:hypothetical protein
MSYTEENLKEKDRRALKIIAKEVLLTKSAIKGYEKANKTTQVKNQNKLIKNLNDIYGGKFKKYKIMNEDDFKGYKTNDRLIELILDIQKLEKLTEEEYERGGATEGISGLGRSKFAENADAIMDDIQKKSQGPITKEIKEQIVGGFDKLLEMDRKDESDETKARAKESGEIVLEIIGDLFKKETKIEAQEELINSFTYIVDRIPVVRVEETDILEDTDALQEMTRRNRETQAQMGKALLKARKLRDEIGARAVKNPAVDMEEKEEVEEPVKMAPEAAPRLGTSFLPSGEMVSSGKGAGKQKQPVVKKEEPYIPLPVVGTDYQGSKEMFEKQKQEPLKPFGGLQSQNEVEAPYLSTKSDKDIGNVRSVGFVGAMDQLAKVEDVTMEPSERSKSLKRFTNFRWVQSVQNSDLGYASPFQRMDDIDDRRRFGKCFMHANKMPKDADTQDELDKAKAFNTYSLVPSFDLSSRMQPATPLSFINSTSKFARKVTGDEMEPINQGKRNVSNLKNKLEFTTLLHSDDPLMRIKDKYKNNIVC